jgi:hypothetical protein
VDEVVAGSRLMEVTVPGADVVAPCGVTFAFWPTRTVAIEASGTLTVTATAPVPTMTTLIPPLEEPLTRVTEPTVPAIEDFSVAEARFACVLLSASSAVVTAAWSEMTREALDCPVPPVCPPEDCPPDDSPPADWLVAHSPPDGLLVAAWLVEDRLADDWPAAAEGLAVPDAVALPAVVIARVTDVMRALWLRVSACWSCRICCCVGTVRRALRQALIAASDAVVVVVVVADVVGSAPPTEDGLVVVVAGDVEDGVGVAPAERGPDGKNGRHCASAADACPRSAEMALWAFVALCWAWARLWPVPVPDRPDGLVTRGLIVGVAVRPGVTVVALAVPPVLLLVLVAGVVVLWSDSRVAFALARDAWAVVTLRRNGTGSMVAKAWPVVTASPTDTATLVTVPATAKLWLTWLIRWTDPVTLRRCSTDPVVTVVVR